MTGLAWLGLAGFSDAVIEWQTWFDQGVMQHWISVKEWIVAVFLDWVPFEVPSWSIDYIVLGGIVMRSLPKTTWNRPIELDERQPKWMKKADFILSDIFIAWPKNILLSVVWPIIIPHTIAMYMLDFPHDSAERKPSAQAAYRATFLRLLWYTVSFIPFLFVTSNLLYSYG
ncbi:MAG: hypothetical protein CMI67_10620 [Pelagibaca sp.]|nr:hypothetical protein [Pelagibaca sp.]